MRPLGVTQRTTLFVLAGGEATPEAIAMNMHTMSSSAAASACRRLWQRGLVERVHRYGQLRYFLTAKGEQVVLELVGDETDEDLVAIVTDAGLAE